MSSLVGIRNPVPYCPAWFLGLNRAGVKPAKFIISEFLTIMSDQLLNVVKAAAAATAVLCTSYLQYITTKMMTNSSSCQAVYFEKLPPSTICRHRYVKQNDKLGEIIATLLTGKRDMLTSIVILKRFMECLYNQISQHDMVTQVVKMKTAYGMYLHKLGLPITLAVLSKQLTREWLFFFKTTFGFLQKTILKKTGFL